MGENTKDNNDLKSRKWLLTINNHLEHGYTHDVIINLCENLKCTYFCMCDEIGLNEHTPHCHIFIFRNNPIRFRTIQKEFKIAHIDFCQGTIQQNRDYIRKEGKYLDSRKKETNLPDTFYESGEPPEEKQGKRNDLVALYQYIKDGLTNYEICEIDPIYLDKLSLIDKTREMLRYEKYKTEFRHLDVTYISGDTATGKTRGVLSEYPDSFRIVDYDHPFDFYRGEDIIIFDEFRMDFKIGVMLNLLDGYACMLPCRYNDKIACYTKVYVISNITLFEQYPNIKREQEKTYEAFLRRFHHFKHYEKNPDGSITIYEFDSIDDYKNHLYRLDKTDFATVSDDELSQINLYFN